MGKNSTKAEKAKRNLEYAQAHKKKAPSTRHFSRPAPSPASSTGAPVSAGPSAGPRQMYPAICSVCGIETTVPFEPIAGKPVQCRNCFQPKPRF